MLYKRVIKANAESHGNAKLAKFVLHSQKFNLQKCVVMLKKRKLTQTFGGIYKREKNKRQLL